MLLDFLATAFRSLSRFEVVLLVAGVGLAVGWNKLQTWTRVAGLVTLVVLGVLFLGEGVGFGVAVGIKVFIAAGAAVLALAWRSLPRQTASAALIVLTLFAALNYMRWGPKYVEGGNFNGYDLLHYYMSARYFEEVGYYDLYPAMALADSEHEGGPYYTGLRQVRIQHDGVYELVSRPEALARGEEVRDNFSDERWAAFKHDFGFLQATISKDFWANLMKDRGFNGTPAFLFVARPLVAMCPVEYIKYLCLIDVILLGLLMWLIRWAYDTTTVLWSLLFLSVTLSMGWPVPGQALLRYDWICGLAAACCLLKKAKPGLAGVAAGYAALMRLFPAVWMFGPAIKGVAGLFDRSKPLRERFDRRLLTLAGAFLATCLVFETGAALTVGTDAIATHADNISEHIKPEQLSSKRVGFAVAYSYDGDKKHKYISDARKKFIADHGTERRLWALALLVPLGWALRRRRDDEAFAYGFIPFFMLSTATYYYFVARLTLVLIHAQDLSKRRNRVGLAVLMAIEIMSNYVYNAGRKHTVYTGYLSWGLVGYVVLMTAWLVWDSYKGEDRAVEPDASAEPGAAKS